MPKYDLIITDTNADIDAARGVRLRSESKQPPVVVILNMAEPQRRKRSHREVIEILDSDEERDTAIKTAKNSKRGKTTTRGPGSVSSGKNLDTGCGPSNSADRGATDTAVHTSAAAPTTVVAVEAGSTQLADKASSSRTTDAASSSSTVALAETNAHITVVGGDDTEPEVDIAEAQQPRKRRLRRASEARRERMRMFENAPSYIFNPYEPVRGDGDN